MRLVIECAGHSVRFPLTEGTIVVGRDPSCDIRFPEPSLSRRHLMCTLRGHELIVRDLNTKNGTFIGFQRIEEARLQPGVRLRAGNCFLYFEEERTEPTPAHPPTAPDIEAGVPEAEQFEEDEEPTPLDSRIVESAAADEPAGTRLIVRDGRWYAQDPVSGIEIEIVPVQRAVSEGSGAPPGPPMLLAPPDIAQGAQALPVHIRTSVAVARPGRLGQIWANPASRAILLVVVALTLVVIAAATWFMWPSPPPEPLTREVYLERLRAAMRHVQAAYASRAEGKPDREATELQTAIAGLDNLIRDMRLRKQRPPDIVRMVREALICDAAVARDFATGWDQAENRWDEVADYSGAPEEIRELARNRCKWLRAESANMALLNDAKRQFELGNYADTLEICGKVEPSSIFYPLAEPLRQQAHQALVQGALAKADEAERAQRWKEAVSLLRDAIEHEPALAEKLQERIARLERNDADATRISQASQAISNRQYAQALSTLEGVDASGPYASQAEDLRRQCRMNAAMQSANSAYVGGQADEALKILEEVGLKSSSLYMKISAVRDSRNKALQAMKEYNFHIAESNWNAIIGAEGDANNYYVQEAKRELALLPERKRQTAQQLADEAQEALRAREFESAQHKFQQALILDPNNASAQQGIAQLEKQAEMYLNMAINERDPRRALQYLLDARAMLPPTHRRYPQIEREIQRLRERLAQEGG